MLSQSTLLPTNHKLPPGLVKSRESILSGAGNEQKLPFTFSEKVLRELFEDDDLMLPGDFRKERYEIKVGQSVT